METWIVVLLALVVIYTLLGHTLRRIWITMGLSLKMKQIIEPLKEVKLVALGSGLYD